MKMIIPIPNKRGIQVSINIEKVIDLLELKLLETVRREPQYCKVVSGKKLTKENRAACAELINKILELKQAVILARFQEKAYEEMANNDKEFERIAMKTIYQEFGKEVEEKISDILLEMNIKFHENILKMIKK